MKNVLVAVDPMALKDRSFEILCEAVESFQARNVFSRTSVASAVHADQFMMPYSYYRDRKRELLRETRKKVENACSERFRFSNVQILDSGSHTQEEIVALVSRHGRTTAKDLLVVGNHGRRGLPSWLLGSFSETAALASSLPVLAIRRSLSELRISSRTCFVVAVDVEAPPTAADIRWLAGLAKTAKARVHLIYIEPRKERFIDKFGTRKPAIVPAKVLVRIRHAFEARGISTTSSLKKATRSVAQSLIAFSDAKGALLTVTTTPKRSKLRKILLGSTARRTLALSRRPFLALRTDS